MIKGWQLGEKPAAVQQPVFVCERNAVRREGLVGEGWGKSSAPWAGSNCQEKRATRLNREPLHIRVLMRN